MITREVGGQTARCPQTGRVECVLAGEILGNILLVSGALTEAVEEGEDTGPVPQNIFTAGHQLGVKLREISCLSVPSSPHQLPHHPLHHGALLQGLGVAGAASEKLEAGPVVVRHLGSVSSCCTNQMGT